MATLSVAAVAAALRSALFRRALSLFVGLLGALPHVARAACGDGVLEAEAPAGEECDDGNLDPGDGCGPACKVECSRVGDPATAHTCLHGSSGPFADRVATPHPGPALSDVNPSHTYYTVVLPGPVGENRGVIAFRPTSSRPYAIYLKAAYPMRLLDEAGAELPVVLEHAVSTCAVADSLTWVRVYPELDPDVAYTLDIGPSDRDTVSFALESLGFERRLYRDVDQDGFGERGEADAVTWCAPPAGYSLVASDCDDRDPATYPGAPELCDGKNNDCDGRGDDTEPGLCAGDPGGGRCVVTDGGASCGCATGGDCPPLHDCVRGRCALPDGGGDGATDAGGLPAEAGSGGAPGRPDAGSDAAVRADGGSGEAAAPRPDPAASVDAGDGGPAAQVSAAGAPSDASCACDVHRGPPRAPPVPALLLLACALLAARRTRGPRSTFDTGDHR